MTTTAEATTATRMTMVLMLMLTAMTMMKPTMLQWQKNSFEAVPLDSLGIDALFFGYPLQKLCFMSEF